MKLFQKFLGFGVKPQGFNIPAFAAHPLRGFPSTGKLSLENV
jgi:hypothetical protein